MDSEGVRIHRIEHSFSLVREVKESWQVHYTYAMLRAHSELEQEMVQYKMPVP